MATPRPAGPNKTQGKAKAPPFGAMSPQTKKLSGPQPPIPAKGPKKAPAFAKKGKPGMAR